MNNKNIRNAFGASLTALAFSTMLTSSVHAQTCTASPTCADLGYTKSAADCTGKKSLKCPFDKSKYFCPDCTDGANCKVGDILYSDKSCNSEVVEGKTPIGIVFEQDKRLAIALTYESMTWSTEYFDIPDVSNISSDSSAKNDWNGKSKTQKAWEFCRSNGKSCPAFEFVTGYVTEGTQAGDWYLPALGEVFAIAANQTKLDEALSKVGGRKLFVWTFSSSEKEQYRAWCVSLPIGLIGDCTKINDHDVRPVLAF